MKGSFSRGERKKFGESLKKILQPQSYHIARLKIVD